MSGPIEVSEGATATLLITGARQLALVASGAGAVLGFVRERDLTGLADWVQGDGFTAFAIAAVGIGTFAYGQFRTWRNKLQTVILARAAPDSVAIVTGETDRPVLS